MADDASEDEVLKAIERDDAYVVDELLADHDGCRTERAHHVDAPERKLLVKRIRRELANKDAWDVLAGLDSPRLPKVVDTYWLPDCLVVVCAWVEGESVADLVARRLRLDAPEVAAIVTDVASALDCLHGAGLVHRDVTPGNVIVRGGRSWLIDLGIMRCHDDDDNVDTTRLGTYGFAPPEQFGFAQTDARSDVYSLARLAAYMLCGTDPGKDEAAFEMRLSDPALVPAPLREVLDRAWSFEPSARFDSAGAFAQALCAAVQTAAGTGRVVAVAPGPCPRAHGGNRRVAIVAGVAALALVVGGVCALLSPAHWLRPSSGGTKATTGTASASSSSAPTSATTTVTNTVSGGADGFYGIGQDIAQSIADGISGDKETASQTNGESTLQYSIGDYQIYDVYGGGTALAFPFTLVNTTDTTTSALKCVDFKFFQDGKEAEEGVVCLNEPENRYQGIQEVRPGVETGGWTNVKLESDSPVEIEVYDKTLNPRPLLETRVVDPKTVPHV